jgi:hypothetical protein
MYLKIDGRLMKAKGEFTYNLGHPKMTAIIGADGIHGPKAEPVVAYIQGAITDEPDLKIKELVTATEITATLELINGKVITGSNCWYAADADITHTEAQIPVRFESAQPLVEG